MSKRPAPRGVTIEALVDVRDNLAVANNLVVAAWLAAQSPAIGANERGALCAVTDAARDRLEAAIIALDGMLNVPRSET